MKGRVDVVVVVEVLGDRLAVLDRGGRVVEGLRLLLGVLLMWQMRVRRLNLGEGIRGRENDDMLLL